MSPLTQPSFSFRTILIYLLIAVCTLLFLAYVLFQARFLLAGPQIFVQEQASVHEQRLIQLEGQAKNIIHMTLNGRQIYTDKDGYFKEALVLENGYTVATLQAKDRYGRTTSHIETFVYTQQEPDEVVIN